MNRRPKQGAEGAFPARDATGGEAGRTRLAGVRFALLLSLGTLAGCGWHLKGTAPLPPALAATYLQSADRHSDFDRALRRTLEASGSRLVNGPREATAIVRVRRDATGRRVLSVSARNTPQEYEVFYTVEYSVEVGGQEVIPLQTLELVNDYSYDETALLAKEREEAGLRSALARDLAGLVVRRLGSL